VLILFAGGIAIAEGFTRSGLSAAAGAALAGAATLPLPVLVLIICLGVTLLSEIGSNTATAVLVLPILAATALAAGIEPLLLMLPAVFAASCGFMLPVATPPNAIVFSTGRVPMRNMLREGLALDLIGAALITVVCLMLVR
jgi:solute carrier family 13 (sodium-dependent dicarboxylate transporter), member 2/3/5